MKRMMLVSSLADAAVVLGLSMNRPAAAELSTLEPDVASSDISQATPSSLVPDLEDDDSNLDSKRGRIGGAGHGMRPAMRPAARPAARLAGRVGRPAGHIARPVAHHRPRPAHPGARIAHHPGHHGHHPGHHPHHPGHHIHHPGHHGRLPLGVVGWVEPAAIGGVSLIETEYIESTTVTEPTIQVVETEETEVETEEVEEETEE